MVAEQLTGRFDRELIDRLPRSLRFVSHNGAGYDQIDANACAAKGRPHRFLSNRLCSGSFDTEGISVSNTPGAVDASTANTAIFLLLGAMRRVHVPSTSLRAGQWRGQMSLGHDPDGKTLGILGMGGIGSAVARRALAFDFKLQYHNRSPLSPERNPWGAAYVDFETLLKTSDVISVHLPLGEETKGMIGEKEFHLMKNGVVLVNTARGAIVDEQALVGAIRSGKVFGAGLDVYEKEPEVNQELLNNENVVLLPHLGTATVETQVRLFSSLLPFSPLGPRNLFEFVRKSLRRLGVSLSLFLSLCFLCILYIICPCRIIAMNKTSYTPTNFGP